MKTKTLMMTALFSMISAAAFAHNPVPQDSREIKHDNAVIAVKKGEVAGDKHLEQAHHDEEHVVKQQKREIKHDKKVIARKRLDKHEAKVARDEDKLHHDHEAGKI